MLLAIGTKGVESDAILLVSSAGTEIRRFGAGMTVKDIRLDSSGRLYVLGTSGGAAKLRKFTQEGAVIWQRDFAGLEAHALQALDNVPVQVVVGNQWVQVARNGTLLNQQSLPDTIVKAGFSSDGSLTLVTNPHPSLGSSVRMFSPTGQLLREFTGSRDGAVEVAGFDAATSDSSEIVAVTRKATGEDSQVVWPFQGFTLTQPVVGRDRIYGFRGSEVLCFDAIGRPLWKALFDGYGPFLTQPDSYGGVTLLPRASGSIRSLARLSSMGDWSWSTHVIVNEGAPIGRVVLSQNSPSLTVILARFQNNYIELHRIGFRPSPASDLYFVDSNTRAEIDPTRGVLSNDQACEGATVSAAQEPRYGTLTLFSDSSFNYEPKRDYVGEDKFTYRLTRSGQVSDPVQVTVRVGCYLQDNEAGAGSLPSGAEYPGTVILSNLAPAGGALVRLWSDSSAIVVPQSVRVEPGRVTARYTWAAKPVGATYTRYIDASFGGRTTRTAVRLTPSLYPAVSGVTTEKSELRVGESTAALVRICVPSHRSTYVTLRTSRHLAAPSYAVIQPGSTSATFTLKCISSGSGLLE
ncbi:MAG TPA: Ig-like domain-containing protein, partial [Fimbriimonadaceae bacterium]|nr:Ig-like domain-containing protein [Fimbriimonadaceae bacterium]